MKTKEIRDVT